MSLDTVSTLFGELTDTLLATVPAGEWLGSRADEGRAKLRKAHGTRMEGKNMRFPNRNPFTIATRNRELPELKHLSKGRKRTQTRCR